MGLLGRILSQNIWKNFIPRVSWNFNSTKALTDHICTPLGSRTLSCLSSCSLGNYIIPIPQQRHPESSWDLFIHCATTSLNQAGILSMLSYMTLSEDNVILKGWSKCKNTVSNYADTTLFMNIAKISLVLFIGRCAYRVLTKSTNPNRNPPPHNLDQKNDSILSPQHYNVNVIPPPSCNTSISPPKSPIKSPLKTPIRDPNSASLLNQNQNINYGTNPANPGMTLSGSSIHSQSNCNDLNMSVSGVTLDYGVHGQQSSNHNHNMWTNEVAESPLVSPKHETRDQVFFSILDAYSSLPNK